MMKCSSSLVRVGWSGLALLLVACGGSKEVASMVAPRAVESAVFEGPVSRAQCGGGSSPETDLQGRVSLEDRLSGRSQQGYSCNLELKGQHQGQGASWQFAWFEECGYYGTVWAGGLGGPHTDMGVQVVDVSDSSNPVRSANLPTGAMLDPWESLKVNDQRKLLGAVAGWNVAGPFFFDVYDIKDDCTKPKLLASTPMQVPAGHEGEWAPDGKTYYGGTVPSAIDVSDPTMPVYIARTDNAGSGHGLSLTQDGNRMYGVGASCGNGLVIFDTSEVQARVPNPAMPVVGEVCWTDGSTAQHTIPVFYDGKPYVIFVDEGGEGGDLRGPAGAARMIDISDETNPRVVSKLKLEIHMPEHRDMQLSDTEGNGGFGYQAHYCGVDREINPTALACGYFQSGVRVFDIRDPLQPAELAYYNPPAQVGENGRLRGSEHAHGLLSVAGGTNLTTDWCTAQVRFVREAGELWTTCQDNGFMVLKFTNGVWPLD